MGTCHEFPLYELPTPIVKSPFYEITEKLKRGYFKVASPLIIHKWKK